MNRQELRIFLGFYCGCGSPELASKALLEILEDFEAKTETGNTVAWDAAKQWVPDDGKRLLFLYFLTHLDIIEHGGTVTCSWLTARGREIREALAREAADDFASLHADHCAHGFNVDDESHNCA